MTEKESIITLCAFRYCLGRQTYIVSVFCEYATASIAEIHSNELEIMKRETEEAKRHDDNKELTILHRALGADCDRADWLKLLDEINAEIERRGE